MFKVVFFFFSGAVPTIECQIKETPWQVVKSQPDALTNEQLLARIAQLERENKALKTENTNIKQENHNLKLNQNQWKENLE